MEKSRLPFLISALPLLGLYGCDLSPSSDDLVTSGGVVNKGILSQAVAKAYQAGTDALVKTVYTEIDGTFALDDVNFDGTLYIEVTTTSQTLATCDGANGCGNYPNGLKQAGEFDQNLNGRIDFGDKYFFHDPNFKLTAYIKPASEGQSNTGKFAVTPLTHLAAEKISQSSDLTPDNIQIVNAQVAELFGLDGADITRVIPPDITNKDAMAAADKNQQLYSALNAAVASSASSTNAKVSDVINDLALSFTKNNGLVGNSTDPSEVTLASLQILAGDVANVVESTLGVVLDEIQEEISEEISEQLAKPPGEIVMPSENPNFDVDSDNDGLSDKDENDIYNTNPNNPDTDGDGLPDGWEAMYLDPLNDDVNNNGVADGDEDFDGDGLTNKEEYLLNTNPTTLDSDGDGVSDGNEDFDGDGLGNKDELDANPYSTDPSNPDTDLDGVNDSAEQSNGSNPTSPNPVVEFVSDAQIYANASTGAIAMSIAGDEFFSSPSDLSDKTFLPSSDSSATTDTNSKNDLIIHDLGTDKYELPLRDVADGIALFSDGFPSLLDASSDGKKLLYQSDSTQVVSADSNGVSDIFIVDRLTGSVTRLDQPSEFNASTYSAKFTEDGKMVLLATQGSNLNDDVGVINDTNSINDIYLYEVSTGISKLISRNSGNTDSGNLISDHPNISVDGRFLSFRSDATDLGVTDSNTTGDIFLLDTQNTSLVKVSTASVAANDLSAYSATYPAMSANGKGLTYFTQRDMLNLGTIPATAYDQIYYYDSGTGQTLLVTQSHDNSHGGYADGYSDAMSVRISADGQYVLYKSSASNLVANDTNAVDDLFMWDRESQTTHVISQYGYGDANSDGTLEYDVNPTSSHPSGLGIWGQVLAPDASLVYVMSNYGDEYADSSKCSGAGVTCLYKIKTHVPQFDSDYDGLNDRQELAMGTNANNSDTDGDGLSDGQEAFNYKTSPINPDTDADGTNDGSEVSAGTDPLN